MTRQEIVTEARSWLGTPFHVKQCTKGIAVDCALLIVGIAKVFNHDVPDQIDYPQHFTERFLLDILDKYLDKISIESAQEGDVLIFSISQNRNAPQHLAIKTRTGMIHSYRKARCVIEHNLDAHWLPKLIAAYSFKGVSD